MALCKSDLTVRTVVTDLGNLNAVKVVIGSKGSRGQLVALNSKRQGRYSYWNETAESKNQSK